MPTGIEQLPSAPGAPPWLSALVVALLLFFTGRALYRRIKERRAAKQAARDAASEEASAEGRVLAPGETVVVGKVELASGEEVASRVEIEQTGSEKENSGTWFWTWSEVDRRVTMRPFYIRHASGQRIRVEPASSALLVDQLDRLVLVDDTTRTRIAELTSGERVFASGVLGHGPDPESDSPAYRDSAGKGWVLRPPATEDMLLSSESLESRFHARAWRALMAILPIGAMFLAFLALSSPFLVRLAFGADAEAVVLEKAEVVKTDSEGDRYTVYSLEARSGALTVVLDSNKAFNESAEVGKKVPVRLVKEAPSMSTLGHGARLDLGSVFGLIPTLFLGLTWLGIATNRKGRWFESKQEDTGQGRLDGNKRSISST